MRLIIEPQNLAPVEWGLSRFYFVETIVSPV